MDGCNNGFGAGGYAIVKDGVVVKVVMTNGGQQYIPNTTETDMDGNVKEVIPDPNAIDPITGEPLEGGGDLGGVPQDPDIDGGITDAQVQKDTKSAEI